VSATVAVRRSICSNRCRNSDSSPSAFFIGGMQVVKFSFVEQICNAYGDGGLAAELRNDQAN